MYSWIMGTIFSNSTQQDQNFETYSLIWLDAKVNESENVEAQKQLRSSINHLVTFENDQKCFEYIESVSNDDRIVFIISGSMGEIFVPKIIQFRQIISIYVYCFKKQDHQQWAKDFSKVDMQLSDLPQDTLHRETSYVSESSWL